MSIIYLDDFRTLKRDTAAGYAETIAANDNCPSPEHVIRATSPLRTASGEYLILIVGKNGIRWEISGESACVYGALRDAG